MLWMFQLGDIKHRKRTQATKKAWQIAADPSVACETDGHDSRPYSPNKTCEPSNMASG